VAESTEIGKRYRILDVVMLSFIDDKGQDQNDYLMRPGDGEISFDGSDILFHGSKTGKTHTSINCNDFIDVMLADGRLEKIEENND
jgi:hypothetical protein